VLKEYSLEEVRGIIAIPEELGILFEPRCRQPRLDGFVLGTYGLYY
jgi:hypothetical protein